MTEIKKKLSCFICGKMEAVPPYLYCPECVKRKAASILPPLLCEKWQFRTDSHRKFFQKYRDENLFIYGSHASGKTVYAGILAKHFIGLGQNVLFVTYPTLLLKIRDNSLSSEQLIRMAQFSGRLFLDDISNDGSETNFKILYTVLNTRELYKHPLVITSNYDINQLKDGVGAAIASRVVGLCRVFLFESVDDLRGKKD
jgi:DNA replication protein DnaC